MQVQATESRQTTESRQAAESRQAKTSGDGTPQSTATARSATSSEGLGRSASGSSSSNAQASNEPESNPWKEDAPGRFGAAMMIPPLEASLSLFHDWRDLARTAADQTEESLRLCREGWEELSHCQGPLDYAKTGAALSQSMTACWAESHRKLTSAFADYASRRLRASTSQISSILNQGK